MSDTPIADSIPTSLWPNQTPVVDGLDDVSQDPNFIANNEVKS